MADVMRQLEPEPWGAQFARARKAAGYTVRDVAEILDPHVTHSGLARLESRQEPPTYRKDRGRAALCLLLYRFQMEDFGVSRDDLPRLIDLRALEKVRRLSTRWYLREVAA